MKAQQQALNRTRGSRWGLAAALLIAAAFPGCKFFESATATTIVSGLLIATPGVTFRDFIDLAGEVGATVWVGERESATSTSEPTPIDNAVVAVSYSSQRVALPAKQSGIYTNNSVESALDYLENTQYTFEADISGGLHGGSVTAPPKLSLGQITFSPEPSSHPLAPNEVRIHPKSTDLTMTWSAQSGRWAYVSVFRADKSTPDKPEFVFDTRPESAGEILEFIAGDPPTSVTIPADRFAADGLYGVILVTVDKGDPMANTFLGSPLLAGSGAIQLLVVGDVDLGT